MTIQATDPRSGLFRFLHHDTLLEWSDNVDERLEYIRTRKPAEEIAGRLAAILRVPDALVLSSVSEARRAFEEAGRAYEGAGRAYEEALALAFPDPFAFALSLGPLPEGVKWQDGALRFNQ